jgi:hypothetical protein
MPSLIFLNLNANLRKCTVQLVLLSAWKSRYSHGGDTATSHLVPQPNCLCSRWASSVNAATVWIQVMSTSDCPQRSGPWPELPSQFHQTHSALAYP